MKSDRWLAWLVPALLLLGVGWWWQATEWHEETVPLPQRGEAARNPWYTLQQLAQGLGVRVKRPEHFDTLPPADATLLNSSQHWDLLPGRATALRRWVEQGGHLVLNHSLLPREPDPDDGDASLHWIPVRAHVDDADIKAANALRARRPPGERTALCRPYAEPPELPGAYGPPRPYQVCDHAGLHFKVSGPRLWSVDGPAGTFAVTVQVGQGRVSLMADNHALRNRSMLDGDHAWLVAALLQLRPGRELWLLTEEKRPPLPLWLWQHADKALLLAGLALLLTLWRAGLRFGPLAAPSPTTRRAVTEQVRGTAAFLAREGGSALRSAQQRALQEAAARHLPGWDSLDEPARVALMARRTGLDPVALAGACGPPAAASHRRLGTDLQVLETARRRLLARASPDIPAPPSKDHHAHRR